MVYFRKRCECNKKKVWGVRGVYVYTIARVLCINIYIYIY